MLTVIAHFSTLSTDDDGGMVLLDVGLTSLPRLGGYLRARPRLGLAQSWSDRPL
jgi:hypothetical protein